jgi:catechol 2,3-dioxygenase-like lactoylglutathione lyase family enzyme
MEHSGQGRVRSAFTTFVEAAVTHRFRSGRDVIIRTETWAQAIEFYGSVLGLPVTHQSPTLTGFETGSFCLYVEKGKAYGPVFEFFVPDVEETKKRLVAAGCIVQEEDPSVPRCYIRDPYGIVFNIAQASSKD